MSEENKDKGTPAAAGAEGAKGTEAKPPKEEAVAKPEAKGDAKPEAKGEKTAGKSKSEEVQATAKRYKLEDDDDEIPEDADLLDLTPRGLKNRLTRAKNSVLKERFGTTDVDSIVAKLKKLEEFEEKEAKAKKEKMDKEERLAAEKAEAEDRAAKAEARAKAVEEERAVEKEGTRLKGLCEDQIKPKYWRHVKADLAEWILNGEDGEPRSPKEIRALKDKDIKKWLGNYLKDNPEFSAGAAADAAKAAKEEKDKKKGLNTGADNDDEKTGTDGDTDPSVDPATGKTLKPGRPNSMTKAEAQAFLRKKGIELP